MKNDYSWVAEKKQEAMRRKLQQRGMPRYAQRPVSERFGVSYTGLGDDGRLDRSAPAGIDMYPSPHVFHEGETRIATPEGRAYLSADVTAGAGLGGQAQGAPMGQGALMPGFAAGGGMISQAAGYTGARDAPQYAPAPRVGSNPYMANIIPGNNQPAQQNNQNAQQYQPRVQGWNVNPAAMGNYGAAMLAQRQAHPTPAPAPAPQQQPAPVPQQPQPNAPAPRVGSNPYMADIMGGRMSAPIQGFAAGGATVETIGEGGQSPTPTIDGSGNAGNSGAGSAGATGTSGTAGASGSGSGINVAGGAQDMLNNSNSALKNITGGIQKAGSWLGNSLSALSNKPASPTDAYAGNIEFGKTLGQGLAAPFQQFGNNLKNWGSSVANSFAGGNGAGGQTPDGTPPPTEPATPEAPAVHTDTVPPQPQQPNPYLQNQIDTANSTPLSSEMFLRNPYTDKQLSDMRRQAASEQAYLQHQQAMRGTDANAAWAQSQMTRAQQEEGINNFAAAAAAQDFDTMRGLAMSFLTSDDPSVRAKGAQMMNHFLPGSGIDWTATITEANSAQFAKINSDAQTWYTMGMTEEEIRNELLKNYPGMINDEQAATIAKIGALTEWDRWERQFRASDEFKTLPPDVAEGLVAAARLVANEGYLKVGSYTVTGAGGETATFPTLQEARDYMGANGGTLTPNYIINEDMLNDINEPSDVGTGGTFDFDPAANNPFSDEFSRWLEADGDGKFKHPNEAAKLVEAMAAKVVAGENKQGKEDNARAVANLPQAVRDAVIDAWIEAKGSVNVNDMGKYSRSLWSGRSELGGLTQAANGNKVVFILGRPAVVTNVYDIGKGPNRGGDYRAGYDILFLDNGAFDHIDDEHTSGWRPTDSSITAEFDKNTVASPEAVYNGKYATKKE